MSCPQPAHTIRNSVSVPRREPMDLAFLSRFTYSSVIATFRAMNTAHLPFFYGTSLRGALGHRIPLSHPLFISAYKEEPDGQARPLIISPQLPPAWESIMAGGPVVLPFAVSTPSDRHSFPFIGAALTPLAPGSTIHVRFTLLGRFALCWAMSSRSLPRVRSRWVRLPYNWWRFATASRLVQSFGPKPRAFTLILRSTPFPHFSKSSPVRLRVSCC